MTQKTFTISGDEIMRDDYFPHIKALIITFNLSSRLLYVNSASLKQLPEIEYALLLISASEKRLSILPCGINERDAVRLCSGGKNRNKPRHIRCHADFVDKMTSLMHWKNEYRYSIIGYAAIADNCAIISFDLLSAAVFSPGEPAAQTIVQDVEISAPKQGDGLSLET